MNALGFVFCILTILSFGAALSLEKQIGAHRLRSSYLGSLGANRAILDQTTSDFYDSLKKAPVSEGKEKAEKRKEEEEKKDPPPLPLTNPQCAQINLYPLIERGPREAPYLYETAAKLLRVFYGKALFDNKVRAEYKFLDAFLKEVRHLMKSGEFSALEKVSFNDPHFQMIYYNMLKGTKKNDLIKGVGYPSLLDYIKIEPALSKICLFHAHPNLLSVFFTVKGAQKLYAAIHTPKAPAVTQETIVGICQEVHAPLLDLQIFDLFEISGLRHPPGLKNTLIGEDPDKHIFLRKVVTVHTSSQ